jgi:hypothetical protein
MRTLTTMAVVSDNHTLTVQVPADILPGLKQVVIVLEDDTSVNKASRTLSLPRPHSAGPVDPTRTYRREEMYGDDGR